MRFKIQILDFYFTRAGEKVEAKLETDERYDLIASMQVLSNLYPVPARLSEFAIEGDSRLFEKGLQLGFFQNVLTNDPYPLAYKLKKLESEVQVEIQDNSPQEQPPGEAFKPYYVQIAIRLEQGQG